MKTYWDLSEKERAGLSREGVEQYLAAELMTKGVLRVDPLALEPEPAAPDAARTFFRVRLSGYRMFDAAFRTFDDAEAFLALDPVFCATEWLGSGSVPYVQQIEKPEIFAEAMLTEAEKDAAKLALKRASEVKDENRRRRLEHEQAAKAQDDAVNGLWEDWFSCQRRAARFERIRATFEEYKQIAGEPGLAGTFLAKAFPAGEIADAAAWLGVEIPTEAAPAVAATVAAADAAGVDF